MSGALIIYAKRAYQKEYLCKTNFYDYFLDLYKNN